MNVSLSRLALVCVTTLAATAAPAAAQTSTFDFSSLTAAGTYGPLDPIPQSYGSTATLAVTNRTVVGFGNTATASCGVNNPNGTLGYYGRNFSSFAQVAVPCQDGAVAQFAFTPAAGHDVRLDAVQLGSWPSVGGVGPARAFQLSVFDAAWNQLFSFTGLVSGALTITPGVSSQSGLYLQVGTDQNVGIGAVTTTVNGASVGVVPEPSTYVMLGSGLLVVAGAARRRRATA